MITAGWEHINTCKGMQTWTNRQMKGAIPLPYDSTGTNAMHCVAKTQLVITGTVPCVLFLLRDGGRRHHALFYSSLRYGRRQLVPTLLFLTACSKL